MDGITPSPRRARQRHDGGRRSRHVSDPQPGLGGACRLEAAHSVPPEIRTCDRRSAKLTQSCRPFRTSSDYPFGIASSRHYHDGQATDTAAAQEQAAEFLEVSGRTSHAYANGGSIPGTVAKLLRLMVRLRLGVDEVK